MQESSGHLQSVGRLKLASAILACSFHQVFDILYSCECDVGYRAESERCVDVDECEDLTFAFGRCLNTAGSYEVQCEDGFKLEDGYCVDVDECRTQLGVCKNCRNTIGSYLCGCSDGYWPRESKE